MKNSDVIKLLLWVITFGAFLWLYDSSSEVFISSVKKLFDLKLNILSFMNAVFWLIGFFGIVSFSQTNNKAARIIFWGVFLTVYTANFLYNFDYSGVLLQSGTKEALSMPSLKTNISNISYIKYFGFALIILLFAYFLKPLGMRTHKYFVVSLVGASIITVALFGNLEVIPMQKIFILPLMLLYSFLVSAIGFLKSSIF